MNPVNRASHLKPSNPSNPLDLLDHLNLVDHMNPMNDVHPAMSPTAKSGVSILI